MMGRIAIYLWDLTSEGISHTPEMKIVLMIKLTLFFLKKHQKSELYGDMITIINKYQQHDYTFQISFHPR